MDESGNLYGSTEYGGTSISSSPNGEGTAFELAPPSTIVKCSHCQSARVTLGDLRNLANSGRRDLFDTSQSLLRP